MSLKKTAVILAAAGALSALALPAMAFENEFHGTSRLRYFLSNYENGGGGNPLAPTAAGLVALPTGSTTNNLKMNNYFEQRTRIFYTAKASDDLKLVTAFEIDSVFGDKAQGMTTGAATPPGTGRNIGGALESDTVNLETKHVYLQFRIPTTTTTVIAGIQPFKDQLKGILTDFDAAGIVTSTKAGNATINAGYFRGYDQSYFSTGRPRGMDNLDIGAVEGIFQISKDVKVGGAYYIYNDSRAILNAATGVLGTSNVGTVQLHTFGLFGDAKLGALNLSGFAAYQGGVLHNLYAGSNSAYLNALAYNLAAKLAAGPGTLRTALLFTSGNSQSASDLKSKHYTGWVGTTQSQNQAWGATTGTSTYNESGMFLLNRNAAAGTGTTDNAIIYNTGNGTSPINMQGSYLYTLGYDVNITPKFYLNSNAGFAWTAKSNNQKPIDYRTGMRNGTNFMGTELNTEAGFKMYDNLTLSLQAAYVILGGFYTNSSVYNSGAGTAAATAKDPENPYTVRTSLIFNF